MCASLSRKASPLGTDFFQSINDLSIHEIEAGNSMLLGYPGSPFGKGVFLLADVNHQAGQIRGFQVNGLPHTDLAAVIKNTMGIHLEPGLNRTVFSGGENEEAVMRMITPYHWRDDLPSIEAGPYRIHGSMSALKAIAEGDMPERILPVIGCMNGPIQLLATALQKNLLGEFTADDDLVFGEATQAEKWRQALQLHTGGHDNIYVPMTVPVLSPEDRMAGEWPVPTPNGYMN